MNLSDYFSVKKKGIILLLFIVSLSQLSPYFILGEHVTTLVNDNLDAYVPQYKTAATKEFAYCSFNKPVPQIMNGLNRDYLVSDLSVIYILFLFFNAFTAFVLNLVFIKVIAFVGMYLFLKNNFKALNHTQIAAGAFLFSCIPYSPFFGIGIAGQPLLINTLINIHTKRNTYKDYLVLVLFPFYSSLIFSNIFILFTVFLYGIYFIYQNKKIPFRLIYSSLVLFILGVIVEYRLIHSLMSGVVFHRVEFNLSAFVTQAGIAGLLSGTYKILTSGIVHVETYYFVFTLILLALYLLKFKKAEYRNEILSIGIYILFIGLLYGYCHSSFYKNLTDKIAFLKTFQIDRFYTLLPFLYFLTGIFCINTILSCSDKIRKTISKTTIAAAFVIVYFNYLPIKSIFSKNNKPHNATYAEFYDVDLFKEVKNTIPKQQSDYRVIAVGFAPEALQYNGFYTLDAYLNLYELSYKKQFRKVIEKELEKSEALEKYFDCWGNRCYAYSAEVGYRLDNDTRKNSIINNFNINTQPLKEIYRNDIYIISSKTINNSKEIGLELVKEFNTSKSFRDILLYKVL